MEKCTVRKSKKTKNFSYTGVDLVPEFIKTAEDRYPGNKFLVRDYFGNPLKKKYDVIISSGALNANIKNALNFRKKAIQTMFEHAKEAVAFNMAGGYPQPENKKGNRVWYADSLEVLNFCIKLTSKIIFRHHYRKNDFTVVLFKVFG